MRKTNSPNNQTVISESTMLLWAIGIIIILFIISCENDNLSSEHDNNITTDTELIKKKIT